MLDKNHMVTMLIEELDKRIAEAFSGEIDKFPYVCELPYSYCVVCKYLLKSDGCPILRLIYQRYPQELKKCKRNDSVDRINYLLCVKEELDEWYDNTD